MKKKTRTDVIFVCVILALVLVILYSGLQILESTVFYGGDQETMQTESKTITRNGIKYFPRQDITVLMLLGIGWEGEATVKEINHGGAVDMVALMIFDPKTEKCDVLNLNRDMMVDMPMIDLNGKESGVFHGQLSYSHTYGTGMEDSCENTRKTISNLLYGLNIDHYFAINMDAIGILNDAVGGVTVNITDDFAGTDSSLVKGKMTLRGEQARTFVQSRMSVGDGLNLSRMRRQEEYMKGFVSALMGKLDADDTFVLRAYESVADYTVTDCSAAVLSRLAEDFENYSLGDVFTVEGENKEGTQYMEFYADEEALDAMILEHFYAPK